MSDYYEKVNEILWEYISEIDMDEVINRIKNLEDDQEEKVVMGYGNKPEYRIYAFEEICEVARVEIRATTLEEARKALDNIEHTTAIEGGVVDYYEGMSKDKGWKYKDQDNVNEYIYDTETKQEIESE